MTSVQPDEVKIKTSRLGFRHVQILLLSLSILCTYFTMTCMSIAIVAMTDTTQNNTFNWSHQTKGLILSSFKWCYVVLKVPAGETVARYGGKIVLTTSLAISTVVLLIFPLAAYYGDWKAVCACRILQGLVGGMIYPSVHNLIGKWVPINEKSRMGSFIYSFGHLGNAIQFAMAGFVAEAWGWEAIFYVNGTICTIWVVMYMLLGSPSPQQSKLISAEERLYIQTSLGHIGGHKNIKTPWKALFTSLAFFALIFANVGYSWGSYTLVTQIPTYLNKIQGVNLKKNGMMSALPYLGSFLMTFPFGFLSDFVLQKKWISLSAARKISNSIGFFGPAVFLILLSYLAADVTTAVIFLTVAEALNAGNLTGFNLVHLDMAPNHAGTMIGITGSVAHIGSIVASLTAGFLIRDETDPAEWRKVLFLASGIYVCSNTFFLIFGTSKKQKWNEPIEKNLNGREKGKF